MVLILFYEDYRELPQIPEQYVDFIDLVGNLFGINEAEKLTFEYSYDYKNYILLNEDTYNDLFLEGQSHAYIFVYFTKEEAQSLKTKIENENNNVKEKEKKEEIKANNNKITSNNNDNNINNNDKNNDSNEIKIPEITNDMVIASIVKQVKENMEKSKIMLQQKEKEKEEEERKRKEEEEKNNKNISDKIDDLLTDRLSNLKYELINESKIKYSQILSESQINLKNINNKKMKDEDKKIIHSLEEHPNVCCTKCGVCPIIGNRYCCVYCSNVNFCEKCEEDNEFSHDHPLYKLKLRIG